MTQTTGQVFAGEAVARREPVRIRLNALQRLMHRWKLISAYNAGQAMQVTGRGDEARWRRAIDETVAEMGLCAPRVEDHKHATFDANGVNVPPTLRVVEGGTLSELYNKELQVPFAVDEVPLRFYILRQADGTHFLAAVYDHWVADSRAMRNLMQRIFVRYQRPGEETGLAPLTVAAPSFMTLYGKYFLPWAPVVAAFQSMKQLLKHRNAHRINVFVPNDFTSHLLYVPLAPGLINKVRAYAKGQGASVNDVFLALMAQVTGDYTAAERAKKKFRPFHFRKNRVGLGTIVDIREQATQNLDEVFGLYLSSYTVVVPAPEKAPLERLIKTIARKTRRYKKGGGPVRAFGSMMTASACWHLYNENNHTQMFYKTAPVLSGISNVNMTGSWVDRPRPADVTRDDQVEILDYLRISPAGPLIPLVFTLTTIGERLSLCMTFRTTAFTDAQGEAICKNFVARLEKLGD